MDSDGTTRAEHARRRAEDLARPERVARCGTHRGSDHSVRRLACRARCRLRAFRSRACRSRRARRTLRGDSLSPGPIPAHALSPVRGLRPSAPSYSLRSLRARAILAHALRTIFWALFATACGQGNAPSRAEALPEGIAARVGNDDIPTSLVLAIAAAQKVEPRVARDHAISDALWAGHAREKLSGSGHPESAVRSASAREVLEELRNEAIAQGPPTDAEVDELTLIRWQEVARPELARTIHAVVRAKTPDQVEKAKRVAERMAARLRGIGDPVEFERQAKAVDAEGLEVKVEQLLPVAYDGRLADPRQTGAETHNLELAFARAANAIANVGEQSPVVQSSYGFHVILLLERVGERMLTLEQRRGVLEREVIDRRAQAAHQRLLERVNKSTPVVIDRAAADLLQRVQIGQ